MNTIARIKKREEEMLSVSVPEAINAYLHSAHFKGLQPRTQAVYEVDLRNFREWCSSHSVAQNPKTKAWIVSEGDEPLLLHQVNAQVVALFLEYYRATATPRKPGATEISTHTVKNTAVVIKTFLGWCTCDPEYEQQVQYVVVQRIELPTVERVVIVPFTDDQIRDLFEACEKEADEHLQLRARTALALMLDTGIRAGGLVTLEIGNVSLDPKDAFIRVFGKGQKWYEVGLGEQSRRLLQKYLRQFRIPTLEAELRKKYKHLPPKQSRKAMDQAIAHEPVFMGRTARPMTVSGLEQFFYRLGEAAHIEGVRCSPHTMRHTFAVKFYRKTKDIKRLSDLLNHSSITTTQEYLKSILQSEARVGAPSMYDEL